MPFKSEKQRRYLWANEPEIARDWTDTYGSRIQKNRGGIMSMQGGMKNYLGEQEMVNAPKYWQSRPDKPPTELAYITDAEKDLIMQADIHGSLSPNVKGNYAPNEGPSGIISLDYQGDKGTYGQAGQSYGDRERPGRSSVDTGRTHHATDTPMKTSTRTVSPKDHFTQSWTGPKGLFSGGYRNLNVPGQTKHGHKSRFNPLGMLLGLINPALGYAVSGFNTLKNIGSRYGTKLGDWREKLTGYRTQDEWEEARQNRINEKRIGNILGRKAPITEAMQQRLANLGYKGAMPGIGSTPQSRAIAKDFNMGLNTLDGPFSTTHLQSVAQGLPPDPTAMYNLDDMLMDKAMGPYSSQPGPWNEMGAFKAPFQPQQFHPSQGNVFQNVDPSQQQFGGGITNTPQGQGFWGNFFKSLPRM